MNIILWGTGMVAEFTLEKNILQRLPDDMHVLGFVDNNKEKWGRIGEYTVFSPAQLQELDFDNIIVLSNYLYEEIYDMLLYWFHINPSKIKPRSYLLKLLLIEKYRDTNDKEIKDILKYLENHELSVYNQYVDVGKEINEVYWDKIENLPYIIYEDKRLYYPYNKRFPEIDGKKVVIDLMKEQQPTSPHLYINGDIKVDVGDVVADVGVCEGNFAIKHIEKASKVYLFESESKWIRPLEKTFEKFKDKIEICNRFVGRGITDKKTSLDSVIRGRLNFLKMDIEGAEVDALIGGRQTLMNNNVKCSICSYHRMNDEAAISDILRTYGYETAHSDGYMFFIWDEDMWSVPEFRRGIVYGKKQNT